METFEENKPLTRAEKKAAQRGDKSEMPKVEVKIETEEAEDKPEREMTSREVLSKAKLLGLFVKNKSLSRYEINISVNEYEAL